MGPQNVPYKGQRLSLKGQTCTVRYVGPVTGKAGDWLGVEWDDPTRGKNNGMYDGHQYFNCRSPSTTAASFLRPSQSWDQPRTFFQAVRDKYISNEGIRGAEIVYLSGKQAEEVGFEKFARRQAQLKGIHVLVLDRMRVIGRHNATDEKDEAIVEMCSKVTDLDLSSNLLESVDEILKICKRLQQLQRLTLDNNRLLRAAPLRLSQLRSLSISDQFSTWQECAILLEGCEELGSLVAAESEFKNVDVPLPPSVGELDISGNQLTTLSQLVGVAQSKGLVKVILKHNKISDIFEPSDAAIPQLHFDTKLAEVDLSYNQIAEWSFFDQLPTLIPGLKHLRVTGNPLYQNLKSAEGKPLSTEDGYMLTIARLPQLQSLNYSKITDKERLNADTYYLSQIATELSLNPQEKEAETLNRHPRWQTLISEYGEPTIVRKLDANEVDPNSLAARLVLCKFNLTESPPSQQQPQHPQYWEQEIPKSFDVYTLLGIISKRLQVPTRSLSLTWVTGEKDPLAQNDSLEGPEWWDSDDEEDGDGQGVDELVSREVEIPAGTRAIGTYFESGEAVVKVSVRERPSL